MLDIKKQLCYYYFRKDREADAGDKWWKLRAGLVVDFGDGTKPSPAIVKPLLSLENSLVLPSWLLPPLFQPVTSWNLRMP